MEWLAWVFPALLKGNLDDHCHIQLTGVRPAVLTISLRHVALRTLADVGALSVAAEVWAWRVLTLIDVLTQP